MPRKNSEAEKRFITYWKSKRSKNKWLHSLLFSIFYGVILSFLLIYFREGTIASISVNPNQFFIYAVVFSVIWFVKNLWQWNRMEKRYQTLTKEQ